jgi:hypothetical protein
VDAALKRKENAAKIEELEAETRLGEWEHVNIDKEQFAMHLKGYMMLTERPFLMDKDEAFARNLKRNYELCETSWRMKKWVSDAVEGGYFPEEYDLAKVEAKIDSYLQLKDYLDVQKELMKNPYYQYMAKKDISYTDRQINRLLENKTLNDKLKDYLKTVKKLRSLPFVRRKDMYSVEQKAEAEGKRQAEILRSREKNRRILNIFSDEALEIQGNHRFRDKDFDAKFTPEAFNDALEYYRNLKVKDLHFKSLRDIADNFKENARIFAENREFEHLLLCAVRRNLAPSEDEMIKLRAKIKAFKSAEYMMYEIQRNMISNSDSFLNGKTDSEFIEGCKRQLNGKLAEDESFDLPSPGMDMDSYYNKVLKALKKEHSNRKKTIKTSYELIYPVKTGKNDENGNPIWSVGDISRDELNERAANFQKNSFIGDYIADLEPYTSAGYGSQAQSFALVYGRKKGKKLSLHNDRVLNRYITGMSGQELKAFFDTMEFGTDEEKEKFCRELHKEMKAQNFTELDTNDPDVLLQNIAYKSRLGGLAGNYAGNMSILSEHVKDDKILKESNAIYDVGTGHGQITSILSQTLKYKWFRCLPLKDFFSVDAARLDEFSKLLGDLSEEERESRIKINDKFYTNNGVETSHVLTVLSKPNFLQESCESKFGRKERTVKREHNTAFITAYESKKHQGLVKDTTDEELDRIRRFYRENIEGYVEPQGIVDGKTEPYKKMNAIETAIDEIITFDLKLFNYNSLIDIVDSSLKDKERFDKCRKILWLSKQVIDNQAVYNDCRQSYKNCRYSDRHFDEIKARYMTMKQAEPLFDAQFIKVLESPVPQESGMSLDDSMHLSKKEYDEKIAAATTAGNKDEAEFWRIARDMCTKRGGFDFGMDIRDFLPAQRRRLGIYDDSLGKDISRLAEGTICYLNSDDIGETSIETSDDRNFKKKFADVVTRRKLTVSERESRMSDPDRTLGQKRENARILMINRETDIRMTKAARRKISLETRMALGEDDFEHLSAFMIAGDQHANERNERILRGYADKKTRYNILDRLAQEILGLRFELKITDDDEFAERAEDLERISSYAIAFRALLDKNPGYLDRLRVPAPGYDKNYSDLVLEKLEQLQAVSDYYRARTLLITDPYYISHYNDEMSYDHDDSSTEDERYISDLIRLTSECARRIYKGTTIKRQDSTIDATLKALEQRNRQRAYLFGQPDIMKADIAYTKRADEEIKRYFDEVTKSGEPDYASMYQIIGQSKEEHPFPEAIEYETEAVKMHLEQIRRNARYMNQDKEIFNEREKDIYDLIYPKLNAMDSFAFTDPATNETLYLKTSPKRIITDLATLYGIDIPAEEIAEIVDGFTVIKDGKLDEKDPKVIAYAKQRWLESMKKLFYLEYNCVKRFESTYGTLPEQLPPGSFMHSLGDYKAVFYQRSTFGQNVAEFTDEKTCLVGGESLSMGQYLVKEGLIKEEELADAANLNGNFYQSINYRLTTYQTMATMIYEDGDENEAGVETSSLVENLATKRKTDIKGPKLSNDEERKYWKDALDEGDKSLYGCYDHAYFKKTHLNIYTADELKRKKETRKNESGLIRLYQETAAERAEALKKKIRQSLGAEVSDDLLGMLINFHPAMMNDTPTNEIPDNENAEFVLLVKDFVGIGIAEKDRKQRREVAYNTMVAGMTALIPSGFAVTDSLHLISEDEINDRNSRIHYNSKLMKTVVLECMLGSASQLIKEEKDKSAIAERTYTTFRNCQKRALPNIILSHFMTDKRYLALKDLGNREITVPDIEFAEIERLLYELCDDAFQIDTDLKDYHREIIKKLYGIDVLRHEELMGVPEKEEKAGEKKAAQKNSDEKEKKSGEKKPFEELKDYPANEENEINESGEFEIDTTSEETKQKRRREQEQREKEQREKEQREKEQKASANKNSINVEIDVKDVLKELNLDPLPQYKQDLGMTTKDYEQQTTHNCWCVAGAALLNKFMNKKVVNQHTMRAFSPADDDLKSYDECKAVFGDNFDEKGYVENILNHRDFMGAGKETVGNVYESADFFMQYDRNMAVRSLNFLVPNYKKSVEKQLVNKTRDEIAQDLILYQKQKRLFLDEVNKVLATGQPIAVLDSVQQHYKTITKIDGENITLLDSSGLKQETVKVDEVLRRTDSGNTIELTWLSKLRDPQEELKEQSNLQYSDEEGYTLIQNDVENCLNPMWREGISASTKDDDLRIVRRSYLPLKKRRPASKQSDYIKTLLKHPEMLNEKNPVQEKKIIEAKKSKKSTEVLGDKQNTEKQKNVINEINKKEEKGEVKSTKLLDEEAEAKVTAAVNEFRKYLPELANKKLNKNKDVLWDDMKSKAAALTTNWEKMTDFARGDALADVLIAANKYLTRAVRKKNSKTEKSKEAAANRFRSFFKTALESMSQNCRVLALERIFKKVDAIEDDPNASEELKKFNNSVFAEMAKAWYIRNNEGIDEKKHVNVLNPISDLHYRYIYYDEKRLMHEANVRRDFGRTKEFMLARLQFDFSRDLWLNMIADDYRVDRFGNVLPEDVDKRKQWEDLFKDFAEADREKLLKIHRQFYARAANMKIAPNWFSDKEFKKHIYEAKSFSNIMLCLQNLTADFEEPRQKMNDVSDAINEWNAAHSDDQIPEEMAQKIETARGIKKELVKRRALYEMTPAIKSRDDCQQNVFINYVERLEEATGISSKNSLKFQFYYVMEEINAVSEFLKNPEKKCGLEYIYDSLKHKNGDEYDPASDIDEEGYLKYNAQNPLIYAYEQNRADVVKQLRDLEKTGYLNGKDKHGDSLERVDKRITLFTKVEADAMKKFDAITGDKGDKAEREAIDKLYKDYIAELEIQAAAAETVFQADMESMDGNHSVYYSEIKKYYEGKAKINRLFDELENAREQFLEKNADENEVKTWKQELKDSRIKAREELSRIENASTTAEERLKQAFFAFQVRKELTYFTNEEFEEVKKHNNPHGSWDSGQRQRIIDTFLVPVERDFSGAYLTDQDRYHEDFNKRFKFAMMSGKEDEIKALSKEFTQKTLPLVKYYEIESVDDITPEDVLEKVVKTGQLNYFRIKLQMLSNVQGDNKNFPLLKTGLDDLKEKDPDAYKKLDETISMPDFSMLTPYIHSLGLDYENANILSERGKEGNKQMVQILATDYIQRLEKKKK